MDGLDLTVFRWINGWPEGWNPFFQFVSEGNKWPVVRIGLGLLSLALLAYRPTRKATVIALLAWPLANGFTEVLKYGFEGTRPSMEAGQLIAAGMPHAEAKARALAEQGIHIRVNPLTSFGTASSHAGNMMAVATAFLMFNRWLGFGWLAVALLTGVSRIYVGVHWPYQVLLGWLCGAFCAVLVAKTWEAFIRLRTSKAGGPPPGDAAPGAAS